MIGDVLIRKSRIQGGVLEKARTAALIDEIPVLAVLGAASEEGLIVRDAAELRVKETDRIATIAENFQRMGLAISFSKTASKFRAASSFTPPSWILLAITASPWPSRLPHSPPTGLARIRDADAASVSFPEFFDTLQRVTE